MTQLEHSRVWRRPSTSEGDYKTETETVHLFALSPYLGTDGEDRSLQFVFSVAAGSGHSKLVLEIDIDDLPVLLASIAELPGGTRVLAEAAARSAVRLQEDLRMVLEAAKAVSDAAEGDQRHLASQPTGMLLQLVEPERNRSNCFDPSAPQIKVSPIRAADPTLALCPGEARQCCPSNVGHTRDPVWP